jgi:hypothetical protein
MESKFQTLCSELDTGYKAKDSGNLYSANTLKNPKFILITEYCRNRIISL